MTTPLSKEYRFCPHGTPIGDACRLCNMPSNPMTRQQIADYLLSDADRCASVVADAYAAWDPYDGDTAEDWVAALRAEIEHRERVERTPA